MTNRKPLWDLLTDQKREEAIEFIIAYFLDERGETIGLIAAEDFLDKILEFLALDLYQDGFEKAKEKMNEQIENLTP